MDDFVVLNFPPHVNPSPTGRMIRFRGPQLKCFSYLDKHEEHPDFHAKTLSVEQLPDVDIDYTAVERRVVSHLAGGAEYLYPGLGDPKPPGGADVLLLTTYGLTCVRGRWSDDGSYLGWAPFPKRNKDKEAKL